MIHQYLVDLGGEQVKELTGSLGSQTWTHSNIWSGGKLTATYDGKGFHIDLADPLGTKRVQAAASGLRNSHDLSRAENAIPIDAGLSPLWDFPMQTA